LYLVIATAAKRKEIDADWKWLEQHLLPTLGNATFSKNTFIYSFLL
jgi:uncharacterized SAM-binding protein YcdF (DUF218 family)